MGTALLFLATRQQDQSLHLNTEAKDSESALRYFNLMQGVSWQTLMACWQADIPPSSLAFALTWDTVGRGWKQGASPNQ